MNRKLQTILIEIAELLNRLAAEIIEEDAPIAELAPKSIIEVPVEETTESVEQKEVTLEEVRAVLAEKSRQGYTAQVKDLLIKHGAGKLSEIKPEEYSALLKDVEVLGNAK